MERRSYERQAVSMGALVHPQQGRSWLCKIRDFCLGGMLLVEAPGSKSGLASSITAAAGDTVSLHFAVPTPQGDQHLRLPARVVRTLSDGRGIGVQFTAPLAPSVFQLLMDFAAASGMATQHIMPPASAEPGAAADNASGDIAAGDVANRELKQAQLPETYLRDKRIGARDAQRIRDGMRRLTERAVSRICTVFFERCDRELLINARDAGTNARQMMYFEGMDQLEKQRESISKTFSDAVLRQVDKVSDLEQVLEQRRRRETGSTGPLRVIDTGEFEDWLVVAETISKVENRFAELLLDIRLRLGLVSKPWGHKDVVPVGPAVLAWAMDDALAGIDVRRQVRQDIFAQFERALQTVLANLYPALSKLLDGSGVFPSHDELLGAVQQQRKPKVHQAAANADKREPGALQGRRHEQVGTSHILTRNPFQPNTGTADVYRAARELLSLGRRARDVRGFNDGVPLAPPGATAEQRFNSEDVLLAISAIERELGDATLTDERLKPRLVQVLKERYGTRKGFGEDLYDTLNLMESLVESLAQDSYLTEGIRDWIGRLEITLNKLAAKDPAFLTPDSDQTHSAIELLNQLARLGNSRDVRVGIDREVGRRVDELLERVVRDFDANPGVFREAVTELRPLVDRQFTAYRGNVERTVRASEGQQKLARARRAVVDALSDRLEGRQVPELLLQLLNPGWRNLLVHNLLRYGAHSSEWRDALAIVDQLLVHLGGAADPQDPDYVEPETVLKRVVTGLNSISYEPGKRTPLVMALSGAIVGDAAGKRAPVRSVEVPHGGTRDALGLGALLPDVDPDIETENEAVRSSWSKALERARRIGVGEWLAMTDDEGRPLILTVAFVGDDASNFVLVNRKGVKTRDLSLKEVADSLFDGTGTLLDDFDIPLVERASQRMLQSMHNQLTWQATHDEVTALLNRKEFERLMNSAMQTARHGGHQHALMYLDVDQFKIINNASGHKAGDELLKLIGERLIEGLAGTEARIARLGGDEFGILLPTIETRAARELADRILHLVRDRRFEWEDRKFSLSVSIGLVFIDEASAGIDVLMRSADQACYAAKDAGRGRVQEYEPGDARMTRQHGVMEWVTQLDRAMDEDRLVLNCQRIAPADPASGDLMHYEILLTMRDELGDMMPPSDFIHAAETYNRVTMVDRWVIGKAFEWMSQHRQELGHFGGFAINVSGHSVNDEDFADFVLQQFSENQVPAGKVCFEVTETAAIANLDNARDFMNRMKIIGCRFALDDFGTGLSSYSYLRNLPVDYVKIDGVFIKDLDSNPDDYAVVRSINEIGHYMGKRTIAECVESTAILDQLREIGVDYVQGFGIEKPCPLSELQIHAPVTAN